MSGKSYCVRKESVFVKGKHKTEGDMVDAGDLNEKQLKKLVKRGVLSELTKEEKEAKAALVKAKEAADKADEEHKKAAEKADKAHQAAQAKNK